MQSSSHWWYISWWVWAQLYFDSLFDLALSHHLLLASCVSVSRLQHHNAAVTLQASPLPSLVVPLLLIFNVHTIRLHLVFSAPYWSVNLSQSQRLRCCRLFFRIAFSVPYQRKADRESSSVSILLAFLALAHWSGSGMGHLPFLAVGAGWCSGLPPARLRAHLHF